ncbi:cell adhesion molecule-related/down-regulated by oncogenes isoform 2-T3 [Anomaloglossus baeobatrachus]|uniref:cell adhesion molecule-related/down-regulated by oncogenes isoform X2 n=1 Tax=Anomaloglossus baeobatrachus TaxID=238106 RepID=UPI003F4F9A7C
MHPGPVHLLLCLSLLLLPTRAESDVSLRFLSEPLSTVQKPGSRVTLLCSAESPRPHISWLFNGDVLDGRSGADVVPGQLTIQALAPRHVGHYRCLLNSSAGSIVSAAAAVSMAYLEDFTNSSKVTVTADEGSSVIINCSAPHSVPRAQMHYKVRGKWLERSADKYLILPSGNLQIFNVSGEDRGPYRCAAYNPMTHERKISASVYKLGIRDPAHDDPSLAPPVITHRLSAHPHDPLTLECVAGGTGNHVRWYKDGRDALADRRRKLWYSHLVIEDVEAVDGGNYSCQRGHDPLETILVNYTVTILEVPYISQPPEDQSVLLGAEVTFTCEAQGHPPPNITWLHNSRTVPPSSRRRHSGSKLHIVNVMAEDSGMYQCMAENGVGGVQAAARLWVQSESGSRPSIVSPPTSVSVVNGDWVTLTCNATGQPTPFMRWFDSNGAISSHPSQILRPKPRKASQSRAAASSSQDAAHVIMSQAGSSSLYIPAVRAQHAGRYVCEASNHFGWTRAEATLTVVPYETSTIHLDVAPSGGTRTTADPVLTSAAPTEKPVNATMLPEAPIILSPPQATKPDMYFLVWRSGRDGGLPINAYFVRYRKLDDDGNVVGSWNSIRVPASENEFHLTELEPASLYEVLMVARNAAGEGQPAMLTFRTSKEKSSSSKNTLAPSPPVGGHRQIIPAVQKDSFRHSSVPEAPDRPTISTASETSVYVTWIPRANGGSPITSFKVEYRKNGKAWMMAAENIPPSMLSVEVSNLEPGAVYKFRVIAINTYGESRHSTVSRLYQVAGYSSRLPNPLIVGPRIDHTEAVTDTEILLKWTYIPANNNNTPIQGFYIYYRPTDSDNDSDYKRDMVEGTKKQHQISHLQPETSYDIKMQCFNERGASDYSNVMMCETKARRSPGASEYPVLELSTPSIIERGGQGSSSSSSTLTRSGDMLYVIVGCVLGGMVLILMTFIAICLLKHRQQSLLHKFEPPGYLYQGSDLNGQMIEYTTLPGTSLINGNIHGGYMGNGTLTNGCPHLYHSVHNGMNGVLNGELYTTCPNSLKGTCPVYEHLPHSISNGGVLYSSVPQTDPSECRTCRNCCNNNSSNGSARAPHQGETQDPKPLGHGSTPLNSSSGEPECAPGSEVDLKEKDVQVPACAPHQDGTPEMIAAPHEGDGCSSITEDGGFISPTPIVLSTCDEKQTRTLDTSSSPPQLQIEA